MRKPKPKVVWNVSAGERKPVLLPYYVNYNVPEHVQNARVGSLWKAPHTFNVHERCYELEGRIPILIVGGFRPVVKTGDLLVYAGVVRVTEQKAETKISVKRHCFITHGVKYVVRELATIRQL
jgi:hypothetical protein